MNVIYLSMFLILNQKLQDESNLSSKLA